MPTNSALSSLKFSISSSKARRARHALAAYNPRRFAVLVGLSFTITLLALGLVDPSTIVLACRADAQSVVTLLARAEAALSRMDVLELFMTGGVAVLALAVMSVAGYLRSIYLANEAGELSSK